MHNKPSLKKSSKPNFEWRVRWKDGDNYRDRLFGFGKTAEAKAFYQSKVIEMANHGIKHGTVSDDERAALILFRGAVQALPEPRPSLKDCVMAFLASIANRLKSITVDELVAKRTAAAETKGVHSRTLRDLVGTDGTGGRLGSFAATFGSRQAAGITAEEIELWTMKRCSTDSNRREMLVRLRGLFAYGVRRRFLVENPVDRLELPRSNPARAHILTVSECATLLAACPHRSLSAVAVQLFAGLRKAEAERLEWPNIDFETNTIRVTQRKGAGAKREKVRFAPLLPALRSWLEMNRKESGPVFPIGRTDDKISDQAYRKDFAKARATAGITSWDENTLRHTFGSYRVASINDLERVKVEMGHTTSRTTSEHYVNAVRSKDAEAFWNLRPVER